MPVKVEIVRVELDALVFGGPNVVGALAYPVLAEALGESLREAPHRDVAGIVAVVPGEDHIGCAQRVGPLVGPVRAPATGARSRAS